jgi:hypothetical protein
MPPVWRAATGVRQPGQRGRGRHVAVRQQAGVVELQPRRWRRCSPPGDVKGVFGTRRPRAYRLARTAGSLSNCASMRVDFTAPRNICQSSPAACGCWCWCRRGPPAARVARPLVSPIAPSALAARWCALQLGSPMSGSRGRRALDGQVVWFVLDRGGRGSATRRRST